MACDVNCSNMLERTLCLNLQDEGTQILEVNGLWLLRIVVRLRLLSDIDPSDLEAHFCPMKLKTMYWALLTSF